MPVSKTTKRTGTKKAPVVSIICIAYNQEKYITQAIEGFLMQETDFTFEIIIHDDASTDRTPEIISEYAEKHPGLFRVILQKENQYTRHGVAYLGELYRRARGTFVCVCEGDDYWTDPKKLQLQVDFLEANPNYAVCFHPVKVIFENGDQEDAIFPIETSGFTLKKLLKENFIQTNTVMYRTRTYEYVPTDIMPIDWYMHLYHAQFGKIGFINRTMAVYRRHSGGMWWSQHTKPEQIWASYGYNFLRLMHEIMMLHGDDTDNRKIINNHIAGSYEAISAIKPQDTSDEIAIKAIPGIPAETWDYMKQLMQQVNHHVEREAYLQRVLDSKMLTNKLLSNELYDIKSSKLWKALLVGRYGSYSTKHPVEGVKRAARHVSRRVSGARKEKS